MLKASAKAARARGPLLIVTAVAGALAGWSWW